VLEDACRHTRGAAFRISSTKLRHEYVSSREQLTLNRFRFAPTLIKPVPVLIKPVRVLIKPVPVLIKPVPALIKPVRVLIKPVRVLIKPVRVLIKPVPTYLTLPVRHGYRHRIPLRMPTVKIT
jgi:hypothetical protein